MKLKHYALFAVGVVASIVAVRIVLSILPTSVSSALPNAIKI